MHFKRSLYTCELYCDVGNRRGLLHVIKQEMKLEFLVWSGVVIHLVGLVFRLGLVRHSRTLFTHDAIELLEDPRLHVYLYLLCVQVSADVAFVLSSCCLFTSCDSNQP